MAKSEHRSCILPEQQLPLLKKTPPAPQTPSRWEELLIAILDSRLVSWLPYAAFCFLSYSAVGALLKARDDPWTAAFVAGAYVNLLLLYWCLTSFEKNRDQEYSPERERLRAAIWILATTLNFMFSFRVTVMLESAALSVVVWLLAALTTVGGFYVIFCCQQPPAPPAPLLPVSNVVAPAAA